MFDYVLILMVLAGGGTYSYQNPALTAVLYESHAACEAAGKAAVALAARITHQSDTAAAADYVCTPDFRVAPPQEAPTTKP